VFARTNAELAESEEKVEHWLRSSNTYKGKLQAKVRELKKEKAKVKRLTASLHQRDKPWAMKC